MNFLEKLSNLLMMSEKEVYSFASTAPHRYKVYTIPKRNSPEGRVIAHPSKELKFVQRVLLNEMKEVLVCSDKAYAYMPKKNIKSNALQHVESRYLLKMDFKSFFPSITPDLFFEKLRGKGVELNELDEKVLAGLLFWKPRRKGGLVLSIGAPSSPCISNFVMFDFDERVQSESLKREVTYTRYADDLTFSTKRKDVLFDFPGLVETSLTEGGYENIYVNKKKTVFSSKAHNRHVTGITLTNENKVSLGRKKKRRISAMVHYFKVGVLPAEDIDKLQGYLSFAEDIEPGFCMRMKKKYGSECINRIFGK